MHKHKSSHRSSLVFTNLIFRNLILLNLIFRNLISRNLTLTSLAFALFIPSYYLNSQSVLANSQNQQSSRQDSTANPDSDSPYPYQQKSNSPSRNNQKNKPRNNPRNNQNRKLTLQSVLKKLFGRETQRPISRGQYCLLASSEKYTIYHTRPVFVWAVNLQKIAIAHENSDTPFWDTNIGNRQKFAFYGGKENLQPGKSYELQGFNNNRPEIIVQFKVMNSQERQGITNELNALEQKVKTEGADKLTVAIARVNYFIDKGLWSDAIQELYSVENPPAELSNKLKDLPEKLCAN